MNEFISQLRRFWYASRRNLNSEFRRTLSFGDYVVDRWEKAKELGFDEGVSIYDSSLVYGDVCIGKNTWIGPFTLLDGSGGGLNIGANCTVSAGVQIYSHDTVARTLSGGIKNTETKPTRIGSNCYIGPNVVIGKGVTIGDRVVVGANSLVLKNIPSDCKAFGSPCQIVGATRKYLE